MIKGQSLESWLDYLTKLHPNAIDLGLSRMQAIAARLNLTTFNTKIITIGGTNGKGSVVKTLEQIYIEAGYSVAAYTSPHLLNFTERLQINGAPLSDEEWVSAFNQIENVRDIAVTFFEFTTLAALYICKQKTLDIILLEVGMGGRLDAVNVLDSDLAVVTNVDIDHVDWLGYTREAVGFEKAGIFRKGKMAVCGDPDPPVSLINIAKENNTKLYCYQKDFIAVNHGSSWEFCGPDKRYLSLPLPSLHLQNVATGLMAIELIGLTVPEFAVTSVMTKLKLPGRYEVLQFGCKVILDVAHNPQAAQSLAERLKQEPSKGKVYAIVGMRNNKDLAGTLSPLIPVIDRWYAVTANTPFACKAQKLTNYLSNQRVKCYTCETVSSALDSALAISTIEDIIVIYGSFYTVADAKRKMSVIADHSCA